MPDFQFDDVDNDRTIYVCYTKLDKRKRTVTFTIRMVSNTTGEGRMEVIETSHPYDCQTILELFLTPKKERVNFDHYAVATAEVSKNPLVEKIRLTGKLLNRTRED